jgi:hypothetical protein
MDRYGPIIGAAMLMVLIIYARYVQTNEPENTNMKWLKIVAKLAPVLLPFIPGIPANLIPVIVQGIELAEGVGGTGPEKKAVAIDHIMGATLDIGQSDDAAISRGIDAVIAAANTTEAAGH